MDRPGNTWLFYTPDYNDRDPWSLYYRIALFASEHPEDTGMVIHELTHIIQNYPSPDPGWVTEGIADYIRRLNKAMREGTYSDSLFKECAGKPLPELWKQYQEARKKVQQKEN